MSRHPNTGSLQMETYHLFHLAKLNGYSVLASRPICSAACAIVLAQRKSDAFLSEGREKTRSFRPEMNRAPREKEISKGSMGDLKKSKREGLIVGQELKYLRPSQWLSEASKTIRQVVCVSNG